MTIEYTEDRNWDCIVRLSLLTMTNSNQLCDVLLFVLYDG